jgi:1,4-alpha-glucan branching enzyme
VRTTETYDPVTGNVERHASARRYLFAALARWMRDFHVDGFRLDSVESVANWDFIGEFTARGREHFRERHGVQGADADARFIVVGEELHHPLDLIRQGRVNGLWNDTFRARIRPALMGRSSGGLNFEDTIKEAIDCRRLGYHDGAEAVNYLGSHDVEGEGKERLATFFRYAGFTDEQIERRAKLAFACLLTAVGIPMILAGEEFGDEHDLFDRNGHVRHESGKQVDPVNFRRLEGESNEWRRRLFAYVSRLIQLRRSHPTLGRNEVEFIHADFTPGRRIMVWKRGTNDNPVVVVANFSDFESEAPEYRVPNWPATPPGRQWREVSQGRDVPAEWIGREPLFAWEAKVYALA